MKSAPIKFVHVLGIDVSKADFHVALASSGDPGSFEQASFSNQPSGFKRLIQWLANCRTDLSAIHACLESTGPYSLDLALFLDGRVGRLSVENPRCIKAYASCRLRRCKSDPADARLIARYALTQQPAAWHRPSETQLKASALSRHLETLQAQIQAQRNRLRVTRDAFLKKELKTHLDFLARHHRKVSDELKSVVENDPVMARHYRLLTGIRGIGCVTALHLLGELPDLSGMTSARQLAAFAGVTPRHRHSGTSGSNFTPISKTGSAHLRKILYWPAISAMRFNPVCMAFSARLKAAGKKPMCIIGAVMNKLLRLVFGVLKHDAPFDPAYHLQPRKPQFNPLILSP